MKNILQLMLLVITIPISGFYSYHIVYSGITPINNQEFLFVRNSFNPGGMHSSAEILLYNPAKRILTPITPEISHALYCKESKMIIAFTRREIIGYLTTKKGSKPITLFSHDLNYLPTHLRPGRFISYSKENLIFSPFQNRAKSKKNFIQFNIKTRKFSRYKRNQQISISNKNHPQRRRFFIQIGSAEKFVNSKIIQNKAARKGFTTYIFNRNNYYRVFLDSGWSISKARSMRRMLRKNGFKDAFIFVKLLKKIYKYKNREYYINWDNIWIKHNRRMKPLFNHTISDASLSIVKKSKEEIYFLKNFSLYRLLLKNNTLEQKSGTPFTGRIEHLINYDRRIHILRNKKEIQFPVYSPFRTSSVFYNLISGQINPGSWKQGNLLHTLQSLRKRFSNQLNMHNHKEHISIKGFNNRLKVRFLFKDQKMPAEILWKNKTIFPLHKNF